MNKYKITAPVMGAIATIYVENGAEVCEGTQILDIECLKTYYPVNAPIDGKVSLLVAPGAQVGQDQWIAIIEG